MSELEIPERAREAACDAYDAALEEDAQSDGLDPWAHAEVAAVRAAAPIIVAAELRRLADQPWTLAELDDRVLRQRADELDPPGDGHG